jgi:hypothetical protein
MESFEDRYRKLKENKKSGFEKCCNAVKDYCSPFCLGGATVFGVAVLGYDLIEHLYRQAGDAISSLPYNFTGSEIGDQVSTSRSTVREYLSNSVELSTKKFAVSWGIGYLLSRKIRGPFKDWMSGRHKHE